VHPSSLQTHPPWFRGVVPPRHSRAICHRPPAPCLLSLDSPLAPPAPPPPALSQPLPVPPFLPSPPSLAPPVPPAPPPPALSQPLPPLLALSSPPVPLALPARRAPPPSLPVPFASPATPGAAATACCARPSSPASSPSPPRPPYPQYPPAAHPHGSGQGEQAQGHAPSSTPGPRLVAAPLSVSPCHALAPPLMRPPERRLHSGCRKVY